MSGRRAMVECWISAARLCLDVAELADVLWGVIPREHVMLTVMAAESEVEALGCLMEAARLHGLGAHGTRRALARAILQADWGLDPRGAREAVGRTAEAFLREKAA